MFMNKSRTDKRKNRRPSVKVSSLNAGYIQQWIGKGESISKFVNDAVEAKHREKEREKKVSVAVEHLNVVATAVEDKYPPPKVSGARAQAVGNIHWLHEFAVRLVVTVVRLAERVDHGA